MTELNEATVSEIARRSAKGEGVVNIIVSMGLDKKVTLKWLQKGHYALMQKSKQRQIQERGAKHGN